MSDDNKFKNGKIYTIRCKSDDTLKYVGSTVQWLYKRLSQHKTDSKKPKCENGLLYIKMNETDINDWYIELYIDCPCERKEQLTQREGQIIREIGTLNKNIPGRTIYEYNEDTKEQRKEKEKERYINNKDQISKQKKEYYEANQDKIKEYRYNNKDKMKEYREANQDKKKEYYEANNNIINEKRRHNRLKKK